MNIARSALLEGGQQLTRSYALVAAARDALIESGAEQHSLTLTILSMADDDLSSTMAVQRLKVERGMGHEAGTAGQPERKIYSLRLARG